MILQINLGYLDKVSIYPNPSKGIFTLGIGNSIPKNIEVTDVTGKIILSKNNFQNSSSEVALDLSSVSKGVYFVKIATDEQTVTKKIIKN
jgi:Secretion system C-terminal sorting domain